MSVVSEIERRGTHAVTESCTFPQSNLPGNILTARVVVRSVMPPVIADSGGNTWEVWTARIYFKKYWGVRSIVRNCKGGGNTVTAMFYPAAECRIRLQELEVEK